MREVMNDAEWMYGIDAADRVVELGPGWDEFALGNDAPELAGSAVIGRSLWDGISDPSTRGLLASILQRVRASGRRISGIPFRCDGPHTRRFMSFRAEPQPRAGVRIGTTLRTARPHRPPVTLLQRGVERTSSVLRMCSWCNDIEVEGHWKDVALATRSLGLLHHPVLPVLTHDICLTCERIVWHQIDRELGRSALADAR
jgi:hypothetical protein